MISTHFSFWGNSLSVVLLVLAFHRLSSMRTARSSVLWATIGLLCALAGALSLPSVVCYHPFLFFISGLGVGALIAGALKMTSLPQLMAAFHSLVGISAVLIALMTLVHQPPTMSVVTAVELSVGVLVGAVTFSGSVVAFGKLQGIIQNVPNWSWRAINILGMIITVLVLVITTIVPSLWGLSLLAIISSILGILMTMPVGGADMPVVISFLNSYSGWAAACLGLSTGSIVLVIIGVIVGASGAILSASMCRGMNRSLKDVLFSAGPVSAGKSEHSSALQKPYRVATAEDAAFLLENAQSVIIVPGYGMATAHAQHALNKMASFLQKEGVCVRYAVHPVAGRMPGHINVLLGEAGIPYEDIEEYATINPDFPKTDVVLVVGANDITNPVAKTDKSSPIYGMPVFDVDQARHVLFIKRSMSAGYSGIDNPLFYAPKTLMLLGDAKVVCEKILDTLQKGSH